MMVYDGSQLTMPMAKYQAEDTAKFGRIINVKGTYVYLIYL